MNLPHVFAPTSSGSSSLPPPDPHSAASALQSSPIELWGGVECTLNRVHDTQLDQLELSGHLVREGDIDLIAGLGLRALRFPVLWERAAPHPGQAPDWRWSDPRLARLRALGVRPIVGLVHHGSGPRHAPMGSGAFASGLGAFAAEVARRYPWVEDWTPVNEPLTTARFAGLYGWWYPHGNDVRVFVACLMDEILGTVAAMREIRRVNPAARLVQTDDLGYAYSTRRLAGLAAFENQRRWLAWDLLAGRVDRHHPLHGFLAAAGADPAALDRLVAEPCAPDVIGINHYVTSERFLDERIRRYPVGTRRHDGPVPFCDVEAVRVLAEPSPGVALRLQEAWERYRRPVAVTEVHLGCTREEQMRWLRDAWLAAHQARDAGADVRAITVWAMLGSHEWQSLLTRRTGYYEPGLFDVRSGAPRPTALARMTAELSAGRLPDHPALQGEGWWRRPVRLLFKPSTAWQDRGAEASRAAEASRQDPPARPGRAPRARVRHAPAVATVTRRPRADRTEPLDSGRAAPVLVIGASSTLAGWLARSCELRGLGCVVLGRDRIDITDADGIERALDALRPWAVVNCAGYVRVDDAERDRDACFRANALGPALLARACARRGIRLVTFSSDLVFDGTQGSPYLESMAPAPLNVYGQSKLEAEQRVLEAMPDALVVRTSAFFSPDDPRGFIYRALDALARQRPVRAAADLVVSPTYVPDLAQASLDLLIDGETGLHHLANVGAVSWADLAARAAAAAGLDPSGVVSCESCDMGWTARRPAYSALGSTHGTAMPTLDDALARFVLARRGRLQAAVRG